MFCLGLSSAKCDRGPLTQNFSSHSKLRIIPWKRWVHIPSKAANAVNLSSPPAQSFLTERLSVWPWAHPGMDESAQTHDGCGCV
jgi:hypothetical protein